MIAGVPRMSDPQEPKFRVCQLASCERYRVERWTKPRWWAFWLSPEWRVVWRPTLMFDYVEAEYGSRQEAVEAMVQFQRWDQERAARAKNLWCSGAKP